MRILLITTHLNVGGVVSYLLTLCREYVGKGHEVFLVSSGGSLIDEFTKAGVITITAAVGTKSVIDPRIYFEVPRLVKLIREKQIHIIHSHTRVAQFLGQVLSFFSGIPYVATCHGFYKTHWFRRTFPCWGKAVVAISPPVRQHLINDFKVPAEKIFLINNGVDLQLFQMVNEQARKEMRLKFNLTRTPILGMVSRLADVKGHSVLLDAMPTIIKKFPQVVLFIAGDGKMKGKLLAQTKRLGIEQSVIFASVFNTSGTVLTLFDVFVMPSLDEGFGLSGIEAQAAGIPLVASNVGGIPIFVSHEKTGLLVEPKDSQALATAILRFLHNPDLAKQIALQARKFVEENFSVEVTATKTIEMYQKVLQKV